MGFFRAKQIFRRNCPHFFSTDRKPTRAHFIYANKMGKKYLKRYKKYFRDPDIREFDMQHEQWVFGEEKYREPVLKVIDEFMNMPV